MTKPEKTVAIEVRPAEERDIAALARLAGQLGYPSTPQEVRERFRKILEAPDHATFAAVTAGDQVIGWIHLCEALSIESVPRAEITGLVVDAEFRSAGAGRRLVERGEEWGRQRGLAVIGVRSNVIRERAREFYEKLGYNVTKVQKVFRKVL